jgi:hypothetical protein
MKSRKNVVRFEMLDNAYTRAFMQHEFGKYDRVYGSVDEIPEKDEVARIIGRWGMSLEDLKEAYSGAFVQPKKVEKIEEIKEEEKEEEFISPSSSDDESVFIPPRNISSSSEESEEEESTVSIEPPPDSKFIGQAEDNVNNDVLYVGSKIREATDPLLPKYTKELIYHCAYCNEDYKPESVRRHTQTRKHRLLVEKADKK